MVVPIDISHYKLDLCAFFVILHGFIAQFCVLLPCFASRSIPCCFGLSVEPGSVFYVQIHLQICFFLVAHILTGSIPMAIYDEYLECSSAD